MFSSCFENRTFKCQSMVSCTVYPEEAANVFTDQISETFHEELVHSTYEDRDVSHAVGAEFGTNAFSAVVWLTMCSKDISDSWKATESDRMKSSVGVLRTFIDKFLILLSACTIQFHPLHVNILNCSEECCRMLNTSGWSVVAYKPIIF